MRIFFLGLLLLLLLLLEGTVTTLPLVFVYLLCFSIIKRDTSVFPLAFVAGIVLDLMTVHPVGGSSLFFVIILFLVQLYQRKYEITSYPFVFVSSFIGSWLFLMIFGYHDTVMQAIISSIFALALFFVLSIT
jgi:cell shape-determining protein MreD